MTTSGQSSSKPIQRLAIGGSTIFTIVLIASLLQRSQGQSGNAYLVLTGLSGLALAAYIFAGWLANRPKGIVPALMITTLSLVAITVIPGYFLADYWPLGLAFSLFLVAEASLSRRPSAVVPMTLSALLGFAALLAVDLWVAPSEGLPSLIALSSGPVIAIAIVMGLVVATLIGIEWQSRARSLRPNLGTQLSLLFSFVSAGSILAVLIVVVFQIRGLQVRQIGQSFQSFAEFQAERVGNNLDQQIYLLKQLWRDQTLTYALNTANTTYGFAAFKPETLDKLRQKDIEWQASGEDSEFVNQYTLNQQTQILARFTTTNPRHSNLIVTDKLGALIGGLGNKPAHYYFGDEAWWKAAWNNGEGGIYIGDLTFDNETGTATVLIAMIFKDPSAAADSPDPEMGRRIGVLASTYNLEQIQGYFINPLSPSESINLISPEGKMIASTSARAGDEAMPGLLAPGITAANTSTRTLGADANQRRELIANAPINTTDQSNLEPIKALGWQVAVSQAETDALKPVTESVELAGFVGILAVCLVILVASEISRRIARPIINLTETADHMTHGDLTRRAKPSGPIELFTLAEAFNTLTDRLQQTLTGLEQRVAERTQDLERRSTQIQAAADVGRAAASILDTGELLQQVVELIRERFGLYYVGLFLVETGGEWAVLRAGTGEAGKVLIARRHRIKVGEGMIGWCISHSQARIAMDVKQDAVRLVTNELALTRSEAAIPLRSRGRVIGALTVQSDQPGVFDDPTIAVLQTMADQVGVALDNAQLFTDNTEALDAAKRAYGELSREAWTKILRTRPIQGYRCDEAGVIAIREGEITSSDREDDPTELKIPVKVRGQVLGVIRAHKHSDGAVWSKDEITMMENLVDQMSVALENARLYSNTQRRAEREQLIAEITARVRASTSIDTILQTAVLEISEALQLKQASVQLRSGNGGHSDD